MKYFLVFFLIFHLSYSKVSKKNLRKIKFTEFNNAIHSQDNQEIDQLLIEYPDFINEETLPLEEIDEENLSLFFKKKKTFSNLDEITVGKGWPIFYWALFYNNKYLINKFIDNRLVKLNHLDTYKRNSLYIALRWNDLEIIKLLLLGGVKVRLSDIHGDTPLHSLSRRNNISEIKKNDIFKLLFEYYYPDFKKNKQDITPLNILIKENELMIVDYLTRNFPFLLEEKDSKGNNPLHWAAASSDEKVLLFLLRRGIPIDSRNKEGWAAIHWAIKNKNLKSLVTLIRENYRLINLQADSKATPLHLAVINDAINHAEILLTGLANINVQDRDGNTPLHLAVIKNQVDFVELLLRYNPDLTIRNRKKKIPIDLARSEEVRNLLLK